MSSRARWYLVGGGLAAVVQLALPVTLTRDLLYVLISASAVAAILVGVRLHRPSRPRPWYLMAAGLSSWAVGDVLWAYYDHIAGVDPFPSQADTFYLLGYPLLVAGLASLAAGGRRHDLATLIDALIVTLSTGLVLWVLLIEPTWTAVSGTLMERVVGVAYPVGDLILLTQLFHLGASFRTSRASLRLLGLAIGFVLVADAIFQTAPYVGLVDENIHLLDILWLAGVLTWAAAALHPSMVTIGTFPAPADRTFTIGRLLFVTVAVGTLPATVLLESALGAEIHFVEVATVGTVLIGLALVRMILMVRQMREQSQRLAHLADTDFLTGLDRRRRFTERIRDALDAPRRPSDGPSVILLVGLERFTEISDTLGHRTGDELLRAVAGRLRDHVDPSVALARMGGDVFGVLLPPGDVASARGQACGLRDLLDEPLALADVSVNIDARVGVALVLPGGPGPLELLQRADIALSAARDSASRVAEYTDQMENGGTLSPKLMAELRDAMERGDVVVHFQPQIDLETGRVLGVEALVRWHHPEHGLLAPLTFVPPAERTGLIRLLTLHVLDRSLAQCAVWRSEGLDLTVSVNLSVRNLLDPGLVTDVREALARHQLDPSLLELEITETMAMVDPTRSVEVLGELDAMGVTLSIDDYGTGYGSLAYLQRLPVRRLKIDRSFVSGVLDDAASAAIVRSTIDLAHHLGLTVVAEGVEDADTLLALRDMRCSAAQGFAIGRPVAASAVGDLIRVIHEQVPLLVGASRVLHPAVAPAASRP